MNYAPEPSRGDDVEQRADRLIAELRARRLERDAPSSAMPASFSPTRDYGLTSARGSLEMSYTGERDLSMYAARLRDAPDRRYVTLHAKQQPFVTFSRIYLHWY